jgi:hypothetical protein
MKSDTEDVTVLLGRTMILMANRGINSHRGIHHQGILVGREVEDVVRMGMTLQGEGTMMIIVPREVGINHLVKEVMTDGGPMADGMEGTDEILGIGTSRVGMCQEAHRQAGV